MPDFMVSKLGAQWIVVNNGVIFSRHGSQASAVSSATDIATRAAHMDSPKRVLLQRENGPEEVVWHSED